MLIDEAIQDLNRRSNSAGAQKRARQLENLIDTAQFLDFTLQGLDAFTLGPAHTPHVTHDRSPCACPNPAASAAYIHAAEFVSPAVERLFCDVASFAQIKP